MGNEKDSQRFRDFAVAFMKEAKEDIETAKELIESKRYSKAVFFSQQCVEKSVKALLEMEKIFVAEHDLSVSFGEFVYKNKEYKEFKKEIELIKENMNYFDGEWSKTRYPKEKNGKVIIPSEIYTYEAASEAIEKANKTYKATAYILLHKFKIKELTAMGT